LCAAKLDIHLAPNHDKDSFRDTLNILTLINYLNDNNIPEGCMFSTNNYKDFSETKGSVDTKKQKNLHAELKPLFQLVNLDYIFFALKTGNYGAEFMSKLRGESKQKGLPCYKDYLEDQRRQEEEHKRVRKEGIDNIRRDNPNAEYLENIKILDGTLSKAVHTRHERDAAKLMIDSDVRYEQYFFKKVNKPNWFAFLKEKGYFDPNKNPKKIVTEKRIETPFWKILEYLEKLSREPNTECIDGILLIIKEVSENPRDNDLTWRWFLKILINLPNDKVTLEVLGFIPQWGCKMNDNSAQTYEICEKLLPKFLNDEPTTEDIQKVELILGFLFEFKEVAVKQSNHFSGNRNRYRSKYYAPRMIDFFKDEVNTSRLFTYCSDEFVNKLGNVLKKLVSINPHHSIESISVLENRHYQSNEASEAFSFLFRYILVCKVKHNAEKAILVLKKLCFGEEFKIPFFKRFVLYVVGETWSETKSVFWALVGDKVPLNIFSDDKYWNDLFELLDKNQQAFSACEIAVLESIIDKGRQGKIDANDPQHREYWQLRWYSAMNTIEPFAAKYKALSEEIGVDRKHFELQNRGFRIISGTIPPVSANNLLEKSNEEIVELLRTFEPSKEWDGPNKDGLSEVFRIAIETNPQKFIQQIILYKEIEYLYAYRMVCAFEKVLSQLGSSEINDVLEFCLYYINRDDFFGISNKSEANLDWVVRAITFLVEKLVSNNRETLDADGLLVVKKILTLLIQKVDFLSKLEEEESNYSMASANSSVGGVFSALIAYAVCFSIKEFEDIGVKWEVDIRDLFDKAFDKGLIEAHFLLGSNFRKFYYLDLDWALGKLEKYRDASALERAIFIKGLVLDCPPALENVCDLFYPFYEQVLDNDMLDLENFSADGFVSHLVSIFFEQI
jgi:hypothetical protein